MAVVITVAQQKGGAGKTTLAANLAAAFSTGRRVAVLDIDPQHSLARWHALRASRKGAAWVGLSDVSGWRLGAELDRLRRDHDVLIVDSPPQIETEARLAVRGADLVLVPLQPSPPDWWAAEGTLKLAAAEKRPARLVLNRAPASGKLRQQVEAEISRKGELLLAATLGNRTGFANAFAQGLGITETAPKSVAAAELRALLAEIEGIVGR
jgi:chromosome partitioning protein